jgi:SAM-dependent methyltransferase
MSDDKESGNQSGKNALEQFHRYWFGLNGMDEATQTAGFTLAQDFTGLVYLMFVRLGLVQMCQEGIEPFPKKPDDYTDRETFLRDGWNHSAKFWPVIERPFNYLFTMASLMSFMPLRDKAATILSLGSGPGLYETYMAHVARNILEVPVRFLCVDYADEMVAMHRRVLEAFVEITGTPLDNITAQTGDITGLVDIPDQSIDQVLCNNTLQWASDWKRVLDEIVRVLNPEGPREICLFVHRRPMVVCNQKMEPLFERGAIRIPELLDELEAREIRIDTLVQGIGPDGSGQMGASVDRVFILACYEPGRQKKSWRETPLLEDFQVRGW